MSFPNPGMLPLSEAGGALSGANFGVFYTVMMQVGYKHYAPQVIEDLNKGMPLFEALQRVQAELRSFNDKIIQEAVDRLPTMFEITIDMIQGFVERKAKVGAENIASGALIPDFLKNLFPSLPEAEARRVGKQETLGLLASVSKVREQQLDSQGNSLINYKGKLYTFARLQQLLKSTSSAQVRKEVRSITPQLSIIEQQRKVKRKAGQSQRMERVVLTRAISVDALSLIKKKRLNQPTGSLLQSTRQKKQRLANLLARYQF